MADLKSLAESRSALFRFDPRKLVVRTGWNARDLTSPENAEHVETLAASIAEIGVKEPLAVYLEGCDVVVKNGHCRLAATMLAISRGAEIATVPCIPEERGSDEADHVLSQIVRNSGKPLSPLEQASVYKKLVGFGWATDKIAARVGKSVAHVNQTLLLLSAPAEVRELVSSGQVSATLAAQVVREDAPSAAEKLSAAVATAKRAGKTKATARHLRANEPKPAPPLTVGHGADPDLVLIGALKKIADASLGATVDHLRFIASEALIEAGVAS